MGMITDPAPCRACVQTGKRESARRLPREQDTHRVCVARGDGGRGVRGCTAHHVRPPTLGSRGQPSWRSPAWTRAATAPQPAPSAAFRGGSWPAQTVRSTKQISAGDGEGGEASPTHTPGRVTLPGAVRVHSLSPGWRHALPSLVAGIAPPYALIPAPPHVGPVTCAVHGPCFFLEVRGYR